ncbi:MAG: hypothetical protein AABW81_03340 [Nanoarchaeota archaeon]
MVREDILEGLKRAVQRGSTLQKAMVSFYNSGYTKEEIEDAARELQKQMHQIEVQRVVQQPSQLTIQKPQQPTQPLPQQNQQPVVQQPLQPQPQKLQQVTPPIVQQSQQSTPQVQSRITTQQYNPSLIQQSKDYSYPVMQQPSQYFKQPLSQETGDKQQVVSKYPDNNQGKSEGTLIIVLLSVILLFLFGILVSLILFKEDIINFLNKLL